MTEKITAISQALTRPAITLLLTGMIVAAVFTDRVASFPDWLVGLCLLVIPGYMGLRSLEKVILPKLNGANGASNAAKGSANTAGAAFAPVKKEVPQ